MVAMEVIVAEVVEAKVIIGVPGEEVIITMVVTEDIVEVAEALATEPALNEVMLAVNLVPVEVEVVVRLVSAVAAVVAAAADLEEEILGVDAHTEEDVGVVMGVAVVDRDLNVDLVGIVMSTTGMVTVITVIKNVSTVMVMTVRRGPQRPTPPCLPPHLPWPQMAIKARPFLPLNLVAPQVIGTIRPHQKNCKKSTKKWVAVPQMEVAPLEKG